MGHHSRHQPENDSNYSNLLSIWDRLGGTYNRGPRFAEPRYGHDGIDGEDRQSLGGMLKTPFMSSWDQPETLPGDTTADRPAHS